MATMNGRRCYEATHLTHRNLPVFCGQRQIPRKILRTRSSKAAQISPGNINLREWCVIVKHVRIICCDILYCLFFDAMS